MSKKDPIRMIDISDKEVVPRKATATGKIYLKNETIRAIKEGEIKKGDPLTVAEIAAIQAVKNTPDIIPLCHPIPISSVDTRYTIHGDHIEVTCTVTAQYKTGVEMEALTGVSAALLNIWDLIKYLEKDKDGQYPTARITDIAVLEKRKG
jgi:cyclic pyranopterin phosphate synthase